MFTYLLTYLLRMVKEQNGQFWPPAKSA